MTMTLSFSVGFTLETLVDPADTQAALAALAQHSPAGLIRVLWTVSITEDEVREVRADGRIGEPAEAAGILQAIEDAGRYVSWPIAEAPLSIPALILPGTGWDIPGLMATPAMRRLASCWTDIEDNVMCGGKVRLGADADELLAVAERHHLLVRGG